MKIKEDSKIIPNLEKKEGKTLDEIKKTLNLLDKEKDSNNLVSNLFKMNLNPRGYTSS